VAGRQLESAGGVSDRLALSLAMWNDCVSLAAAVSGSPVALICVRDGDEGWSFTGRGEDAVRGAAWLARVCDDVLQAQHVVHVPDVLSQPHLAALTAHTAPRVRSYTGVPLLGSEGRTLGVLCVIDFVARELTEQQISALRALARQTVAQVEALHVAQRLEEREQRVRAILDAEPECVKLLDRDGSLLEMNPAGLRMIEADSFDQVERQCMYQLVTEEYRRGLRDLTERVFRGESGTAEFEVAGLKGGRRWLETHATPLRDADGAVTAALGITRDITERRLAENRLRQSEQRFAQMFYSSPIALLLGRFLDRAIVDVNGAFESLTGYSRAHVAGHTFGDLGIITDHLRERYAAELRATGRFLTTEIPFRCRTGETRTVVVSAEQMLIDGEPHALMSIVDVTERNAALERLREVVENIREAFWVTDPAKSQILYVSPAYEAIWGRTCADLHQNPSAWLEAIHADDRPRIEEAARTKQVLGTYDETYRIVRPDGAVRWIRDRAFPVRQPDGTLVRLVGTASDITDERRLEDQLRQAQKMESVGRLAGGIAHDFNNLLTVINGTVELILSDAGHHEPLRGDLSAIREAGDRAATLTRQLLALSRQQILSPQVVDLRALLQDLHRILQRLIGEDIELRLSLASDLGRVKVDPSQFEQVILNLAVNARDAMPNGGTLLIEAHDVGIDAAANLVFDAERTVRSGPDVRIAVSDTGTGMDEHTRDRIFEPFFTTKPPGKGTGLGLSTVHGIVQQSGGSITVYSEVGLGTTFTILLPRVDDLSARTKAPRVADVPRGSEAILVVEDERPVRDLTTRILSSAGYHVLEAGGGDEALLVLKRHKGMVHLALTDVVMRGMNGRELATRLRELQPSIKVLYTSGYTDHSILRHGVLEHGRCFISKPFTAIELRRKVREMLDASTDGHGRANVGAG
jgi:two-component system, cell cycle sensor histidine kinase and response regulator CckA